MISQDLPDPLNFLLFIFFNFFVIKNVFWEMGFTEKIGA